jgi:hypothetical protein
MAAHHVAATGAANVYLYLDGSDLVKMITVLPTVSFDDFKVLVENQIGFRVALSYIDIDDDDKIILDDDDALRIFFDTHQGKELKISCAKARAVEEQAMPILDSRIRRVINIARNVRNEEWSNFTCTVTGVDLPQTTAAMKKVEHLQSAYNKWATRGGKVINEVRVVGTNNNVTIKCRGEVFKPSVIIFDKDNQSVVNLAAIIELTCPSEGDSVPGVESDAFKQIAGHLHDLLDLSPGRTHVYGILTNHRYVVFVKAQRARNRVEYVIHHAGSFCEDFLRWILNASLADLGLKKWEVAIDGKKYLLDNYLGSGRHSIGFEVDNPAGKPIIVKYFADPAMAKRERDVCEVLAGVDGVTQLADVHIDDSHFVAVTPKGLPFNNTDRRIRKEHVRCLRQALLALHRKNLAHNDVLPCNIYYIDESRALLADWSNVTKGSSTKSRRDFRYLANAVDALGGSEALQDLAQDGERKRGREAQEEAEVAEEVQAKEEDEVPAEEEERCG